MLRLMMAKSFSEADQDDGLFGKPGQGGGPECLNGSAEGVAEFEFPAL